MVVLVAKMPHIGKGRIQSGHSHRQSLESSHGLPDAPSARVTKSTLFPSNENAAARV